MEHIHFIGIGGVGMNGLAQLAVRQGFSVSGSDRAYDSSTALFRQLKSMGIRFFPQDGSGIDSPCKMVIYSTAIESDNPDLIAARTLGLPMLHRAELLNQLIGHDARLIAIAGTAGKTTTTGMLGWIFECLGQDPSVYNGAAILNWKDSSVPGNIRAGLSATWIIEADESDKSFLNFHPTHSIITNISKDHYEIEELQAMFTQFRSQTAGLVLDGEARRPAYNSPTSFIFEDIEFTVPMPGRHNLENAWCAVQLCAALDMDLGQVSNALREFKGIERRLEILGQPAGITVIDDYAHNPAKISAALSAASETCTRLHAYWRPHGFTPLFQGMDDFVKVFIRHLNTNNGTVYILPVYYAGGTVDRKATAEDLVNRLKSAGGNAIYVPDYSTLKRELERTAVPGDTILGMGARDPELPAFANRLVREWKSA